MFFPILPVQSPHFSPLGPGHAAAAAASAAAAAAAEAGGGSRGSWNLRDREFLMGKWDTGIIIDKYHDYELSWL